MRARTIALAAALGAALAGGFARAAEGPALPKIDWSFERVLGTFDPAARQRGFQVYQNVCSACHALGLLHYRDLAEIGYDAEQVKAFAAATEADDGPNDEGEMFKRPGRAADKLNVSYGAISGSMAQTWLAKGAKLFDKYGLDVNLVYISGGPRSIMALIGRTRCQK